MSAEWPAVTRKRKVARLGVCLHFRITALGSEKPSEAGELQGETRCPWRSDAPRYAGEPCLKKYRARIGKLRAARRQGLERVQTTDGEGPIEQPPAVPDQGSTRCHVEKHLGPYCCSANEIASITGHFTLEEVARHTKVAQQKKLARAAIGRLLGGKIDADPKPWRAVWEGSEKRQGNQRRIRRVALPPGVEPVFSD